MKTDRFFSAGILLAGLLAAGLPAAGQFTLSFGGTKVTLDRPSRQLARDLAREVDEVQGRFDEDRRALHAVPGADGKPAYLREEVTGLIARTGKELDQAIERVGESDLSPLQAWSEEEIRRIQEEIGALSAAAALSPRAVAIVASLGASAAAAAPRQETISAETANGLLDQVGAVASRIFFLAERDDLEVELWVGSSPAPKATFRFWSQGKVKGSTPAPTIVQTNGKRKRVLRGLYAYQAAWAKGAVTELVAYPSPAAAALASERLDLVNGSSYFCCQFNEAYCHHVDDEKECRP